MTPKSRGSADNQGSSGRRYPEQPLSRDRIVRAALALVDAQGVSALSMRRLAAALGVDPMAIYYYLPNKAALQDAIVEAVHVEIEGPPDFVTLPLYDLVMTAGRLLRAALLAHPNAVPLITVRPLATPLGMEPAEAMLAGLVRGGLTPAEGVTTIDVFGTFVTGSVLRQVQMPAGPEHDGHVRFRNMHGLLDETEFPTLSRALSEGGLMDFDAEFEFGLSALARGLVDFLEHKQARQGRTRP